MPQLQDIPLSLIRTDGISYHRKLDQEGLISLSNIIQQGTVFPPIICFFDGNKYWLANKIDIFEATKLASQKTILVDIWQGRFQSVIDFIDNKLQYLKGLSNYEKKQLVTSFITSLNLLSEEDKRFWSSSKVATICEVSQSYAHKNMGKLGYKVPSQVYRKSKAGTRHLMNTDKIGEGSKLRSKPDEFTWSAVDDRQFEELIYEIVNARNPKSIEWRTGTGGQGRDIEAKFIIQGSLDESIETTYFIEAKHQKKGISPIDIYPALAWVQAKKPSVFVIATPGSLTNPCRSHIEDWKKNNYGIEIILWEKKRIETLILDCTSAANLAVRLNLIPKSMLKLVPPSS